jgi:hypothetical protein
MKHAAVLAVLIAAAFGMSRRGIYHSPYDYDESDYMFAASLGMADNWLDTGTMSIADFVSVGRSRGSDPGNKSGLSDLARSGVDPIVYRHWHGPLYYFWLTAIGKLGLNEHDTRALFLIFPILTVCAIYFGTLRLFEGMQGQIAAILASALFLWSPINLESSELAPHLMFVLWYICALLLLARVALNGSRRAFYAATVLAGLAFCTLEVDFVLVLVLLIVAWWKRAALRTDRRLVRNSILLFLATVLLLWPSAILKLNFAKAWMVMAYLAVFRKGAWGDDIQPDLDAPAGDDARRTDPDCLWARSALRRDVPPRSHCRDAVSALWCFDAPRDRARLRLHCPLHDAVSPGVRRPCRMGARLCTPAPEAAIGCLWRGRRHSTPARLECRTAARHAGTRRGSRGFRHHQRDSRAGPGR